VTERRNLIKLIENSYSQFSKSQKIIADYIVNEYDKAAFMTAATLGQSTGVSESTVVRFAIRLGYEGYREFQRDLQELIKSKLTTIQRLHLAESDYANDEDFIPKIIERDMDNIKRIIDDINMDSFKRAIDLVLEGKNIYIIGLRSSSFLAGYLAFYLNFLFDNIRVIDSGPNDIFEQLLKVNSDDVIIVITYPRYSRRIVDVLDYCKDKGTKIITITDSRLSPAAERAHVSLIAASDMISFVDSLVAPMSLINAFIVALGIEKKENLNNYFEDLENIWQKFNIYDEIT